MKRSTLKKKLDKLCSEITRTKGYCEKCGRHEGLQTHHIWGRVNLSVRWDLENLLCLCPRCHWDATNKNPIFNEWLVQHLGEFKYNELKTKATMIKKWREDELIELYEQLKIFKDGRWV